LWSTLGFDAPNYSDFACLQMITGCFIVMYLTLVARSYAHHLGSGDGLAGSDSLGATFGGDDENSAYVKFDSLLGGRRGPA
jgi:hypothetical protein